MPDAPNLRQIRRDSPVANAFDVLVDAQPPPLSPNNAPKIADREGLIGQTDEMLESRLATCLAPLVLAYLLLTVPPIMLIAKIASLFSGSRKNEVGGTRR